ncbi:MAG: hypothetical protein FWD87_00940 [Spirochaetaceae bacterium]|nr:hypothetical protein [Spirochaetaceae bacterium]
MSIQPIDLQTLFLKMSHVGKDQAVAKESAALQQAIKGGELEKRTQHSDTSVNKADHSDEGPEKTKEDADQGGQNQDKRKNKKNNDMAENKEILSDPDLGKNIDISG